MVTLGRVGGCVDRGVLIELNEVIESVELDGGLTTGLSAFEDRCPVAGAGAHRRRAAMMMAEHTGIKGQATRAAAYQGHTMGAWDVSSAVQSNIVYIFAQCIECYRHVWINTETHEIGGFAIREICKPR
jgi:hypothetical protein